MLFPLLLAVLALGVAAAAPPAVHPHPRVQIDPALIREIRGLRASGHPWYTRFHNYVSGMPTTTAFPASVVNSYLLAYVVTEEPRYLRCESSFAHHSSIRAHLTRIVAG